jgi:multidrug efflux pump subunit AcrA (membrane-fusion protein)
MFMKTQILILITLLVGINFLAARDPEDSNNLVILTKSQIKNAAIRTTEPSLRQFETTLFTIGQIKAIPSNHSVISSRITGRAVSRPPIVGDVVEQGQVVLKVESNQPGSPPPIIELKAPAKGVVFESHTRLGEPVDPADEVMDIVDLSQVWAVASIPESQAHRVKVGQTARIKVVSLGKETFSGKLIRFGTEANPESNTLEAIFLLENTNNVLRPNMLTEFDIVTSVREKVLSVPSSAIQGDELNPHLFKKDYELKNAFEKVPVVLGERNKNRTEIILQNKELNVIDEVVINGGYLLSHTQADKTSLKEALDEAHGHEHNEDGSEMTPAQKASKEAEKQQQVSGGKPVSSDLTKLLIASNAITLLLLIVTVIRKKDIR